MAKKRRTPDEVAKLVAEVDALRAGGMSADAAADKVGLARSVYARAKKKVTVQRGGQGGKVDIGSLPPRPKKGGKRKPKQVDMNDIASVAVRIARLDKKLRGIDDMVRERIALVGQLVKLLKKTK